MTSNSSETKYSNQLKALRSRLDNGSAVGELRPDLFERLPARGGDEGLQRFVDRR